MGADIPASPGAGSSSDDELVAAARQGIALRSRRCSCGTSRTCIGLA